MTNPMMSNEEKKIITQKMENKPQYQPPPPLLNLTLHNPPKPPPKPQQQPINFVPYPYLPGAIYQPPTILKNYNIEVGAINGDHFRGSLQADILPIEGGYDFGSYNSLKQRLYTHDYFRHILFSKGDGNNFEMNQYATDNPFTRIAISKKGLNPYNTAKFSTNPYHNLPVGFFLYSSCYPIDKTHSMDNNPTCTKYSSSVNIRIYKMIDAAYFGDKLQNNRKLIEFDLWREIAFYEYIRDNILKKHECPHFPLLYGYHIPHNSGIDFDNIGRINYNQNHKFKRQENKYTGKILMALTEAYTHSLYSWASPIYSNDGSINRMIKTGYHTEDAWKSVIFQILVAFYVMQKHDIAIKNLSFEKNIFIKDLKMSGEVNTYWKYIIDGIEYFIPNHGYLVIIDSNYRDKLAVEKNQTTNILQPEQPEQPEQPIVNKRNNVDLSFGLRDFLNEDQNEGQIILNDEELKIKAKVLEDNIDFKKVIFENMKQEFAHGFTEAFNTNKGFIPEPIQKLLHKMSNDSTDMNISYYIQEYMKCFMNNRIGTMLKESEKQNVRQSNGNDFIRGEIAVYTDSYATNKFCLYLGTSNIPNIPNTTNTQNIPNTTNTTNTTNIQTPSLSINVLTRDNDNSDIIIKNLPLGRLYKYTTIVEQTPTVNNGNINGQNPLDTYKIN